MVVAIQIKEYIGYFGSDKKDKEVVTKRKNDSKSKKNQTTKTKTKK